MPSQFPNKISSFPVLGSEHIYKEISVFFHHKVVQNINKLLMCLEKIVNSIPHGISNQQRISSSVVHYKVQFIAGWISMNQF